MKTLKEELEDILADMQDVNDKLARLVNDNRVEWPELETTKLRREDYVLVETNSRFCHGCVFYNDNMCDVSDLVPEFECTGHKGVNAIFKKLVK